MAEEQKNEEATAPRVATKEDLEEWARIVADPENLKCSCYVTMCEYHGNCLKCVALHKYYKGFPGCLRDFVNERVEQGKKIPT